MKHASAQGGAPHTRSDEAILTASGLRLGYGSRTVLGHVDLEVRPGEFWFLIGPNGHGKTTLLQAILGRLRPLGGQIVLRGDFARADRIGFVPQHCALNPTLPTTVREFVMLGLVGIRADRRGRAERLAWALAKAGLRGMEARDYWSLSGGQRQRALVARALVRRPRVLIADEPTSGLDLSVESALLESLAELNRVDSLTLIVVTHDLGIAARYGTRFALVHHGCVEAGPAQSVLTPSGLGRAYGVPVEVYPEAAGSVSVRIGPAEKTA